MIAELPVNTKSLRKGIPPKGYMGKSVTEIIANGFFTVDRKWMVKYWNTSAEKLLGIVSADIVGKNLWEQFAGAIPLDFYRVYHKAFLQDIPIHFREYWAEKGAWFDVITYHNDDTLSVSFKSSNQPLNPDFSIQPEHPLLHLSNINQLYRLVTEVTNDCLWEWDLQTKELFWIDGGHKRVFGFQVENALVSQDFWESGLHAADKERVLSALSGAISSEGNGEWKDEYRFRNAEGGYVHVRDRARIIRDERGRAVRMIGAMQDISEIVLLEEKLEAERKTKQAEVTDAVFTALENERLIVGNELNLIQSQELTLARLYLQMAQKHDKNKDQYLEKSYGFLVTVIDELSKISKSLVIPRRHGDALVGHISAYLNDLRPVHAVDIQLKLHNITEDEMDAKLQLLVFRIIQEQVNNIIKHANATQATIQLMKREEDLLLIISDNGRGCDLLGQPCSGVGILNIRTRVALFHGTVMVKSKPLEGFRLKVTVPLTGTNSAEQPC